MLQRVTIFITPDAIRVDQTIFDGVLVREKCIHHLRHNLLRECQRA